MKRTVIGILAHVDAGKTTLSEAMLYCSGNTRRLGRVDHGDAFLDNFALERQRGITIFSKQALLSLPGLQVTLLDTPGHVDFSAEMERTLDVMDCAILVISGPAGIQSHTRTLWKLLRQRKIPTFLFVNKMDLPGTDWAAILQELKMQLSEGIFDFSDPDLECLALRDEGLLEEYLETETLSEAALREAVVRGNIFPCWSGAALKLEGVEVFLTALAALVPCTLEKLNFSAKVFKISRDEQGRRLSHLKITGGVLRVRDNLHGPGWEEKTTQLRRYSGRKYTSVEEAYPGDVVAAVGLQHTMPGMGLGMEPQGEAPTLEPVLTYTVLFPEGCDKHRALQQFRQMEEEDPQLRLHWDVRTQQLRVQMMGPIQLEVLRQLLLERFDLAVDFSPGHILYRETIQSPVEGVGHYEPLRHYAEVHLLLEPGARGSGLRLISACPENQLDQSWQRLILTHLQEKQHLGVLTGSPITDMTITLTAGRAHERHTEGGDFRQATYRAVRQGLMQAQSILLEPWYDFRLELPRVNVGRAITDLQRMGAGFTSPEFDRDFAVLTGYAPVAAIGEYPRELAAYTQGLGRLFYSFRSYEPCTDPDSIISAIAYDPEADLDNPADSIFCNHGAGFHVKWQNVPRYMHLSYTLRPVQPEIPLQEQAVRYCARAASDEELMAIFERTYGPIHRDKARIRRPTLQTSEPRCTPRLVQRTDSPEYVLVDGYNIIYAWDELRELAQDSLDTARARLIEILRNYQGFRQCPVIVVFDAYKVRGNPGSVEQMGGLSVVYTKEAETADMYIERASYTLVREHKVRVATSDGMEQMIILGHGALRVPASAFVEEVRQVEKAIREALKAMQDTSRA